MKIHPLILTLACVAVSLPVAAQTNVGVSVSVAKPGVYGRIDINNFPQPAVIYPQPVIIQQRPVFVQQQPIYLYVPPGHQKHWAKHCARYNACGQPVYFVKEGWVRERYEEQHRHDRGRGDGHGHGKHDKHDKHGKHGRD